MNELPAGATFADHLIRGVAGRGGMGVVYRALHLPLEREVALKVLLADVSALPEFRTRFRREFRAAAAIQHPHVIPIYNAGEWDGRLYVTMRYIDGTDLSRLLSGGARLPPQRAIALIAQVAGALDAAHELGIVHRDVKPGNVLIEGEGDAVHALLTDFGLMKNLLSDTQVTQSGSFIGTFDYAAPEQLREQAVDARTDVYALGGVLYQALTGRVPFPFETAAAKMLAHLETAPPVPSDLVPELPDALDDVVARALAKDPDDRFPSAGDLARAALAALGGEAPGEERSVATGDARPAPAPAPIPLPAPLVGRERFVGRADALARLERRYELAERGERQCVLVCGEAGIGKTTLAGELGRRVHGDQATVLYGRSDPESLVPYQPFITAMQHFMAHREGIVLPVEIEPELHELARFVPALRRRLGAVREPLAEDPETRRYRLFEAVTRVVAFVARRRPVVLVLDDLHWADTSSVLLLGHLLRDPEPVRLLVIGTARDEEGARGPELPDLLARLRRDPSYERIALPGLDGAETEALVAAREERDVTGAFLTRLREETSGNPFFIEETLRALDPGEDPERALSHIRVPEGVKEMISRRLARLSDATNQVLTVASVVGRDFRLRLLAALLDEQEDHVLAALEEAAAAGLVRELEADAFAYAHALVRETLYERQSASRRVRLHLRIGEALEADGGADAAELAYHFYESRHVDEQGRAFGYSLAAADAAAAALAYAEAVEHYHRARELAPDDRRGQVLLGLGHAQERAGDPEARATFGRAAELARERGAREGLAEVALGFAGRYAEAGVVDRAGIALLEEALTGLAGEESPLVVRLLARLADNLQFADEAQTEALSRQALELAREIGDPGALVAALESRHGALLHIEHLDERLRLSAELLSLAEAAGERELAALGHHWRIYDLLEAADVDAAREQHAALQRLAEALRQPLYRHFAVGWEVVWAQMAGQVADAERLALQAYELGRRAQARDADTVHAAQLLVLRRREDRLQEYVSTVESFVAENPALVAWRSVLPLAHMVNGDAEAGVAEFERLAAGNFAAVPRDMFWFTATALLAETCALLRDQPRGRVLYAQLLPHRERMVQATQAACLGSTERFLGLLAGALGEADAAVAHLEAGLERNAARGIRPVALRMRRELAEALLARGAAGDVERATELLRRTVTEAELAGMASFATLVRTRIAELE